MTWENYTRDDAEKGAGGDWPDVVDDLYDARVMDVSEPEERPNTFKQGPNDPDVNTQFYVTFELLPTPQQVEDGCPEGATLRYYVNIPERFINEGYLGEKSKLFSLMSALGFDLNGPFRFQPMEWIDLRCRVLTEHKNGKGEPTERARITKLQEARKRAAPPTPAPRAAGSRQPVGAAAGRAPLRERLEPAGSDEEFE